MVSRSVIQKWMNSFLKNITEVDSLTQSLFNLQALLAMNRKLKMFKIVIGSFPFTPYKFNYTWGVSGCEFEKCIELSYLES